MRGRSQNAAFFPYQRVSGFLAPAATAPLAMQRMILACESPRVLAVLVVACQLISSNNP